MKRTGRLNLILRLIISNMLKDIERKNWCLELKSKYLQILILVVKLHQQSGDEEFVAYYDHFSSLVASLEKEIVQCS